MWTWAYATSYTRGGSNTRRAYRLDGEAAVTSSGTTQEQQSQPKGIYDSWLLLRLSIALACLW